MILQKPAFVFDGRNILNGLGSGKICVSKYRFLGLHQTSERGSRRQKGFCYQKITDYTNKRYTVDGD
jgi:hypothetical protein